MKTLLDYLSQHKSYQHPNFEIMLELNSVVLKVDDTSWSYHKTHGAMVIQSEIQDILENEYDIEIRFCEECGAPMDAGFTTDDGLWYSCENCFESAMDDEYGKDNWRSTFEAGEFGGYYEALIDGKWEDTGIYYTEWY